MAKFSNRRAGKCSARAIPPDLDSCPAHDKPDEEIKLELIGLLMGIARIQEIIRDKPGVVNCHVAVKPHKPPARKKTHRRPQRADELTHA